jgi:hypothetical protein
VLVGVVVSVALILLLLRLVRQRRLRERYAILWLTAALVVVVFGVWKDALEALASAVGIAYPPSALFMLVLVFFGLVLLDSVMHISKLATQVQILAQRLALLDEKVTALGQGRDGLEDGADDEDQMAPVGAERRSGGPRS